VTVADLLRDMRAEHAARMTYQRAVERHFSDAERLAKTDPKAAERIAWGAVALRIDARMELRP
jgi:hypothetical protein